jgi:D-3-phosphoglycerate dehydrogenase
MVDASAIGCMKRGLRFVNVARGQLVDEEALVDALERGIVHSAALDVLDQEPLPVDSPLRRFESCIFGSHNASNTLEGVRRASDQAIKQLFEHLELG